MLKLADPEGDLKLQYFCNIECLLKGTK